MREILFRGKSTRDHKWHIGAYIPSYEQRWSCQEQTAKTKPVIEFVRNDFIPDFAVVDDTTVGQFTGMTDKNGKRIFEGDIVKDARNKVGYVAFLQQAAGWVIVWDGCDSRMGHRTRDCNYDSDASLEVIGNIHDNPELLEGGASDGI